MKRYNIFHAPVMSFFSRNFYCDVGLYWKGSGFGFLLLLLAVCWAVIFVKYQTAVSSYIDLQTPALVSQIPTITIVNGEASADIAQPHEIREPVSGMVLALIDTTGQTVSLEGTDARILLTKTEVIVKKNNLETRSFQLKNVEHFTLDQQRVSSWLRIFRNFSAMVFFPFIVIGSYVFRIVQTLLYAVIGLFFAKLCRTNQPYPALLRLSVMAITPVIIVKTISSMANFKIPLPGLLFFIAAMVYLFIGVKASSRTETAAVGENNNP